MHHGRKQTLSYPELLASGSPFTSVFQSSPPCIPLVSQSLLLPAYLWKWLGVVVVVIVCGQGGGISTSLSSLLLLMAELDSQNLLGSPF